MAYEMVMPYHLHMPSYFLETFTEYPPLVISYYNKDNVKGHSYISVLAFSNISNLNLLKGYL